MNNSNKIMIKCTDNTHLIQKLSQKIPGNLFQKDDVDTSYINQQLCFLQKVIDSNKRFF